MAQAHILTDVSIDPAVPAIRRLGRAELMEALARGWDDFSAMPSHALFLCAIYPAMGILLAGLTLGFAIVPLLFPLAAGFALIGPFAAIGLYELSRQRELGLDGSWKGAFGLRRCPAGGGIIALGVLLLIIFILWIAVAEGIYIANLGHRPAGSVPDFRRAFKPCAFGAPLSGLHDPGGLDVDRGR